MLEMGEPIRLQFLLDMPIDIVKHLLHILNGLVNGLLLSYHLFLPTSTHQRGLLDQSHHLVLLFTGCHYLLLAVRVLQYELRRRDLHLIVGCCLLPLLLIGVVVILDEQVDTAFQINHQILWIFQGESNVQHPPLLAKLFSLSFHLIQFLFRIIHLHE